jgi:hypothetical protein
MGLLLNEQYAVRQGNAMNTDQDSHNCPEHLQALEFDVVRFIMHGAKSGQHRKLVTLLESTQEAFPGCGEAFIRQCMEKVGVSLRE